MIYIIRSAAVVDESIPSFEFILKIGYCRDNPNNSIFNRKPDHSLHNTGQSKIIKLKD